MFFHAYDGHCASAADAASATAAPNAANVLASFVIMCSLEADSINLGVPSWRARFAIAASRVAIPPRLIPAAS
jgi:hypothetical protein